MSGGDLHDAFDSVLKGGITGGMFGAVGSRFAAGSFGSYAGHAAVGCASAVMQGGGRGTDAVSQAVSK